MNSSEFRAEARKRLQGKWKAAIIILLAYLLFSIIIGFIQKLVPESFQSILSLGLAIIEVPIMYGLTFSFIKLYRDEEVHSFDFFELGFSNFGRAWIVKLHVFLKMLLPSILAVIILIILILTGVGTLVLNNANLYSVSSASDLALASSGLSGITIILAIAFFVVYFWLIAKSYYYSLADYIAIDNPNMEVKDAVEKSEELMKGNRFKLFCLQFSFIGWAILAVLTIGIGYLWLIPYVNFATIAFYVFLSGNTYASSTEVVDKAVDNDTNNNQDTM